MMRKSMLLAFSLSLALGGTAFANEGSKAPCDLGASKKVELKKKDEVKLENKDADSGKRESRIRDRERSRGRA